MTWDHPRGYAPLEAATREWRAQGRAPIDWDRRSLQDFESFPVEELARRYDLIIIDHPHVGQVARSACLAPLDLLLGPDRLAEVAAGSVGGSYESYCWDGRQLALPVDAATQVQAWVPERLARPLAEWRELGSLAGSGAVMLPLRPPHALMALFSLCGLNGVSLDRDGPDLFPQSADRALAALAALAATVDPACYAMDPIAVLEEMANATSPVAVAPLIYGYVSYASQGFRPVRVAFADVPVVGPAGPAGTALGGTGIAVSALGADPVTAAEFALWVASGRAQQGVYAANGGQPAHAQAWQSDAVNAPVLDFYRATRATIDGAWVRPRHDGYMHFQAAASERLNEGLRHGEAPERIRTALNTMFRDSR